MGKLETLEAVLLCVCRRNLKVFKSSSGLGEFESVLIELITTATALSSWSRKGVSSTNEKWT